MGNGDLVCISFSTKGSNMIIKTIIDFASSVLVYIVTLFPDQTAGDVVNIVNIVQSVGTIENYFAAANFWFPVDTLFLVLQIILAFELGIAIYKIARWIGSIISVGIIK
jgi:hypothetical protein